MKQFKRLTMLLLVGLTITAHSQSFVDSISKINGVLQPDPMRGDFLPISELSLNSASLAKPLPLVVSNDTSRYFPPIFLQTGNSCLHAAEIGYTFTYEMNRLRDEISGSWNYQNPNVFPYLYTFNFFNEGGNVTGTPIYSGFKAVLSNGCPKYSDWCYSNGQNNSIRYWMDGYEKYHTGMRNRVFGVKTITLYNNYYADDCVDKLKHWLADHGDGSDIGGVAVVCVYTDEWVYDSTLPAQSAHSGEYVISQMGINSAAHAMTIVGYDDNVCYDINGDGYITTDIDINGDGRINIFDSEYGALRIANSWGTGLFGNGGFIWLPYSLLNEIVPIGGLKRVYVCEVEERNVQLAYKATIGHLNRGHLSLQVGYGLATNEKDSYNIFANQGGDNVSINGIDNNPITIGLDFSSKYGELSDYKHYYLQAIDNNTSSGSYNENNYFIRDFSLMDYRWGEAFELPCPTSCIPIGKNTTTTLSINYDLLPFDGNPVPINWNSDKVARRTVNIRSNTQIGDDVNLDMYGTDLYDCELFIKSNTTITIGDGVTFTAKRGTCRIVVNGNLVLGENVRFLTENGATLELDFSNAQSVSSFNGTIFQNCNLSLPEKSLSFQRCTFTETPLVIHNQSLVPGLTAVVDSCLFVAMSNQFANAICIKYYDSYFINNNCIDGNESHFTNGIYIMNCGNTNTNAIKRISKNSISDCSVTGLQFYASSGNIMNNKITGNKVGVKLLNNSNVKDFSGTCDATDPQYTQFIHDNDNFEVLISENCIPLRFKYNAIYATASHPYIKYEKDTPLNPVLNIDISINYWGNGLNPSYHFMSNNPNASFTYIPLWPLGTCLGHEGGGGIREMVVLADSLTSIGNYGEAKLVYKQIVSLYPSTVDAQVALKTLFNLECVSGMDFNGLKSYYLDDIVIAGNNNLNKLASSLSNRCNEALRRFDDAIAWYENVLLDTLSSFNDSIFAAIDLGE